MGAELCSCQFNGKLRAFGNVVERDPSDVMLDRIGVWDLLADSYLYFQWLAGLEWREERYDWDVLFSFPVGGFDEGREHFD